MGTMEGQIETPAEIVFGVSHASSVLGPLVIVQQRQLDRRHTPSTLVLVGYSFLISDQRRSRLFSQKHYRHHFTRAESLIAA